MKPLILPIIIVLFFVSCKNDTPNVDLTDTTETNIPKLTLDGAWELTGFYNYVDNKVVDSFPQNEGYKQIKIYTDHKVMWSKHVPEDSTEWFGYGNYNIENNHLMEVLDYGSHMMEQIINEKKIFEYELILNKDTFSQIELDDKGNRLYSENYKRIE